MDDLSAFILAGGRSTRMGRDKAFLKVEGVSLLDRALALARAVTSRVWIVGDAARFLAAGPVVEDVYPDCGPLAGIHAALRATETEFNLMLAVDLPFLDARFLQFLVNEARGNAAVVTVPESGGRFHPLCAVYRRQFAELAEQALSKGENKIDALYARTETRVLAQAELTQRGFAERMFHNLNTPQDLELLKISRA